jgi:hypothetical protein
MKKIYILFIALSAFFLMGCENDPIHYSGPDFVSFNEGAINKVVKENEDGILEITLGVSKTSNADRTFSVVVDAANTTAVEGQDYEFVNKTVTIPAGKYTGVIKVKGNYDNLTPEAVKLTLNLVADQSMLQEGTTTSVVVNLSRFFEITMDWLEGNWLAQDTKNGANDGDPYDMTIEQINGDTIAIGGLFGVPSLIKGIVDYDNAQIQIPMQQYMFSQGGADYFIFNVVGSSLYNKPIVCDINFRGITTGSYGVLNASYSGWFPYITVMVKEE